MFNITRPIIYHTCPVTSRTQGFLMAYSSRTFLFSHPGFKDYNFFEGVLLRKFCYTHANTSVIYRFLLGVLLMKSSILTPILTICLKRGKRQKCLAADSKFGHNISHSLLAMNCYGLSPTPASMCASSPTDPQRIHLVKSNPGRAAAIAVMLAPFIGNERAGNPSRAMVQTN